MPPLDELCWWCNASPEGDRHTGKCERCDRMACGDCVRQKIGCRYDTGFAFSLCKECLAVAIAAMKEEHDELAH
jgi:hypothetical protein